MSEKREIGGATLYHGDCHEILPETGGANCMITDPPYGCTCNEWDRDIDLDLFWKLAEAACVDAAPFLIFCQMPFAARLYMSNPKMFRYEWIYKKPTLTGFLDARKKPLRAHELVYVFCRKFPEYFPQMKEGEPYRKLVKKDSPNYDKFICKATINDTGARFPTSILEVKHESAFYTVKPQYERHPTQKSVAALSWLIRTYTRPGDIVCDPFMGSGSTGVAAIRHGRRFIGIEREEKWFDVACGRISEAVYGRSLLAGA